MSLSLTGSPDTEIGGGTEAALNAFNLATGGKLDRAADALFAVEEPFKEGVEKLILSTIGTVGPGLGGIREGTFAKQGAIISDDGYTTVLKNESLGYGWQATLWDNDRLVITHDATGETLSLPPESTRTLMDICDDIMSRINEAKLNKKETDNG